MQLTQDDGVYVIDVGAGENRLDPAWVADLTGALDVVESGDGAPLVLSGSGKFFSNGLDVDWLQANPAERDPFLVKVHHLLRRLLVFPTFTVAAIQGHAFAAGAMLALACDRRVMRADRGFVCLPEVDIDMVFTPGMAALIQAKLSPASAHEAMVTGRRYAAPDALAAGIVDEAVTDSALLGAALTAAKAGAGKDPRTLGAIKEVLYARAVAGLAGRNPVTLPHTR